MKNLQHIYLTKDLYPEYMKDANNSVGDNTNVHQQENG